MRSDWLPVFSISLKQNLSLVELEQQLGWVRAVVESASPLSRYLLADDENALAEQVVPHTQTQTHACTYTRTRRQPTNHSPALLRPVD